MANSRARQGRLEKLELEVEKLRIMLGAEEHLVETICAQRDNWRALARRLHTGADIAYKTGDWQLLLAAMDSYDSAL
jgi:hypothetical protein